MSMQRRRRGERLDAYLARLTEDQREDWIIDRLFSITDEQIIVLDMCGWKITSKDDHRRWSFDSEGNGHACPEWCADDREAPKRPTLTLVKD
jgi:hypothetical protein